MRRSPFTFVLPLHAAVCFCLSPAPSALSQTALGTPASWAYQLQNLDIAAIEANRTFDLIVIDYSAEGDAGTSFSTDDIARLKSSGKTVLAYMSIGEAETYRFYWRDSWDANGDGKPDTGAPSWLGRENPEWEGNYKVRFWDPGWQEIIFTYLDTVISRGYDGIYMDIVDAYYYWSEEEGSRPDADTLMIAFVRELRKHADAVSAGPFALVPQNGEYIIVEVNVTESLKQEYLGLIDGIGVEDLFFYGSKDNNNSWNPDQERIDLLDEYHAAGLPVLSVEYLSDPSKITRYLAAALSRGYLPYVTDRELDRLEDGLTAVDQPSRETAPASTVLHNYPNPFNGETVIRYTLAGPGPVVCDLIDMRGRRVRRYNLGPQPAGDHTLRIDSAALSTGVYLYRFTIDGVHRSGRCLVLK
ncbi:endo alpha-1,4 polygalactosaminidase [bacterium]|nr:endo alpha-1,4 polygalactosaminidase [bacterium]